jgi:tRNA_anti-like
MVHQIINIMRNKIIIVILALVIGGGVFGYLQWNKPHSDMNNAKADMSIAADMLMKEYDDNKYLNKTVQVTGIIKEVVTENDAISIKLEANDPAGDVSCDLDKFTIQKEKTYNIGDKVTMKGICTGKLMDIVVDRCVLVQ